VLTPTTPSERGSDLRPDPPRRDRETAEAAEARSAFLAEVGAILAASLDYEVTLASLVRLAVPRIADYCTLFEVAEGGLRQVASAHVDPAREPLLRRLGELYFAASGQPRKPSTLVARVVETGSPLLIRKESYEGTEDLASHPELLDIYRRLDRQSSMILPLSARGQTLGVLFLATAESERRYEEADLALGEELARRAALAVDNARLYREAQAASEAKDRFLAALSHELRTPLTPVLALVAGLQEDERANAFQRELAIIRRNVELEARLIDDLLDLTRISRGKLELRREVVDLRQVVEHAVEACATELSGAGLRLAVELGPGDQRLWADPPRLIQVFWNLLRNAIKFTPAGGTLAVRSRLEAGEAPQAGDAEGWLAVTVADTGMGIDPEILPLIFEAFEQGRSGIARRFGGLGLGLAISKAIVELHGGTLTAASAGRQQGAAFTVRLPVTAWLPDEASPSLLRGEEGGATVAAAAAAVIAPEPAPSHILLVEDHLDTAEAMADLLRAFGFHVSVASSVAGGLALAEERQALEEREPGARIDLLVSDIGLPDGSGLDLIRALGERWGIRGIALSGYGTEEDVQRSREAGFLRHLTKPVTPRVLEAAVREALNRKI
jgi:signal transduction histidine kinase/CheY-like chemotaxis protein